MIRLHAYNHLVEKRRLLLLEKEKFYAKYFTREDSILDEMITKEERIEWWKLKNEFAEVNELIEGWEANRRKA